VQGPKLANDCLDLVQDVTALIVILADGFDPG